MSADVHARERHDARERDRAGATGGGQERQGRGGERRRDRGVTRREAEVPSSSPRIRTSRRIRAGRSRRTISFTPFATVQAMTPDATTERARRRRPRRAATAASAGRSPSFRTASAPRAPGRRRRAARSRRGRRRARSRAGHGERSRRSRPRRPCPRADRARRVRGRTSVGLSSLAIRSHGPSLAAPVARRQGQCRGAEPSEASSVHVGIAMLPTNLSVPCAALVPARRLA